MLVTEDHVSPAVLAAGCCATMAVAATALFGVAVTPMLIVIFVICQGAGYGVVSILRPVLVAELLGRRKFGVIAGLLAAPFIGVFAIAPTIAGIIWTAGGYKIVIAMAGAASLVAVGALLLASRLAPIDTT